MKFLHLILLENQNNCHNCGLSTTYIRQIKESYVNNDEDFERYIKHTKYVSCTSLVKTGIKE